MKTPRIVHLAFVDRPASREEWTLMKSENGTPFMKFQIFTKVDSDGVVGGLGYCKPYERDTANDWAAPEDIRDMARTFEENGMTLNLMHKTDLSKDQAVVLSSTVRPDGSWYVTAKVFDPELKKLIQDGKIKGWSVGGFSAAAKRSADPETAELEEMYEYAKSFVEQLEADNEVDITQRQLEEALAVAQTLLADAHDDADVLRALEYCGLILDALDAIEGI